MINSFLCVCVCDFFSIRQLFSGSFGCKVQVFPAFIFSWWLSSSGSGFWGLAWWTGGRVGYKSRTWRPFLNDTCIQSHSLSFPSPGQHIIISSEWGNRALQPFLETVPGSYATFANTQEPALRRAFCCYAVLMLFLNLCFVCEIGWDSGAEGIFMHCMFAVPVATWAQTSGCPKCLWVRQDVRVFHLWLSKQGRWQPWEVMPSIQTRTCSEARKRAIAF